MQPSDRIWNTAGIVACCLMSVLWLCRPVLGAEQVVQNDSIVDGSTAIICPCFALNESAAVWLTSPCDGNIVAVQVFWRSLLGGAPISIEDSITIFDGGVFPVPGPQLETLPAPVLTDGVLNEFRFLDENLTIPISVPVTDGQVFVVSLRFFNANNTNPTLPSVVFDNDGCQSLRNAVFVTGAGGGWTDACALGVSGDWMIRVVVDCGAATGACCMPDGSCMDNQTSAACAQAGGTFQGGGSTCAGANCPVPTGACCFMPSGCLNLSLEDCGIASGFWQGPGTDCATTICFASGACCLPDGTCSENVLETDCIAAGGIFQGDGVLCSAVNCPQPTGACCLSNGNCLVLIETDCQQIPNASWAGPATDCADLDTSGTADDCEADPLGDFVAPPGVDGLDLQPFVDALTSPAPTQFQISHGDFNGNGVLDVGDANGMVTALLAVP